MVTDLKLDAEAYKVTKTTPPKVLAAIIQSRLTAKGRCQMTSIGPESSYAIVKALAYLGNVCTTQFALFELKPTKPYPNAASTTCVVTEITSAKTTND